MGANDAITIQLMGPNRALRAGSILEIGGPKQRDVLTVLALSAGSPVSTDRMIDLLWDDAPPPSSRRTIQSYVAGLRRALADDRLLRPCRNGYMLEIGRDQVDLLAFEDSACLGLSSPDQAEAASLLEAALAVWQTPFSAPRRSGRMTALFAPFEELQLQAVEGLVTSQIASGNAAAAVCRLQTLVRAHSTRENLWLQLARGLATIGRRDAALLAIQRAREAMREQLGVNLSVRLTDYERELVSDSPRHAHDAPRRLRRRPVRTTGRSITTIRRGHARMSVAAESLR